LRLKSAVVLTAYSRKRLLAGRNNGLKLFLWSNFFPQANLFVGNTAAIFRRAAALLRLTAIYYA